jgi:hypothetical protein
LRAPTACRHPVSGTVSLPSLGCFSPFPHGTCSLSVAKEYLGLEGGPPMFRQDCTCPALLEDRKPTFPIRGCHPLRPAFPDGSGTRSPATGLVRFRSPLLAESRLMSFPPATEMFQFAGFASQPYGFRFGSRMRGGLPHSETPGSKSARLSSGLIAACHVLHRLLAPRHPPDALHFALDRKTRRPQGQAPRTISVSREDTLGRTRCQAANDASRAAGIVPSDHSPER